MVATDRSAIVHSALPLTADAYKSATVDLQQGWTVKVCVVLCYTSNTQTTFVNLITRRHIVKHDNVLS